MRNPAYLLCLPALCVALPSVVPAPVRADEPDPLSALRGEIDAEVFLGGKFYSADGALGRGRVSGDPNSAFTHSGIIGLRLGYLPMPRLAIEVEVGASPTRTHGDLRGSDGLLQPNTQATVTVLPLRAHLLVNLFTGRFRPFLLAGGGVQIGSPLGTSQIQTDATGAIHVGAGAKLDVRPRWGLRLEGRLILAQGISSALAPEGEVLLSFYGRALRRPPPPPVVPADRDGDGVPDAEDACPDQPGLAVHNGCPGPKPAAAVPPPDRDRDGVPDAEDACPDQAGPAEQAGCPDTDRDSDGVPDRLDRCPDQAGPAERQGCPAAR